MRDLDTNTATLSRSDEEELFQKEVIQGDWELYYLSVYLEEMFRH